MAVITSNSITFIDNSGLEKYLYIRYSNDGENFTVNNGLTPGAWLGTCTTSSEIAPTNFNAYTWSKIRGEDGNDGIPGTNGEDGKTTYFHVKYSDVENPTSDQMKETPSKYIGTYVDYTEEDSENPEDYKWSKFIGDDGVPGTNGIDGKTYYLHIKYSNDGGQTFTGNDGEDPGDYLGVYTDEIQEDSTDVTKYTWSLIKGKDGKDATTYYTWIKYADDANGSNMSDDPTGKTHIGIAYNKESEKESEVASDYLWSLIQGANGIDGDDGITYYTWIKYANDNMGNGLSDDPIDKEYIGIAYNKLDPEESEDPADYVWSLFKGQDGLDGKNGVAGKGIKSITEYYLISQYSTGIGTDHEGWSKEIPTLDSVNKYLWNYEETTFVFEELDTNGAVVKTEEVDKSEPIIIGVYGETGSSLQVKYLSSATIPVINNNDVSVWSDVMPAPIDGQKIYMTQKLSSEINWSAPIQISATDGATPTMEIIDGYWYINGESTDVKAEGADGNTPVVIIGENGNWFINGVDTGTKAQGEAGKDGSSIEYVYYRSNTEVDSLDKPSYTDGVLTVGWTASPMGITPTYKCEYVSVRTKPIGEEWGDFSTPVIWSKWGEKGQDGDGVEYRYYLSNSSTPPEYIENDPMWTDEPSGVSAEKQYEYIVQIKISNDTTIISEPSLWAKYGVSGSSLQIKYLNSDTVPTIVNNDVSAWFDTVPAPESGKRTYMIQKLSSDINWSTPIQISGLDGADGSANVEINDQGYWVINGENTGIKAEGQDGIAPTITINDDGFWVIDGNVTTIQAQGEAGKDGASIEYVYYQSDGQVIPNTPSNDELERQEQGWTNSPQGVTADKQYEYISARTKSAGTNTVWGNFSTPVIWSKWGEKGQDGDGVEYKYCLWSSHTTKPLYPTPEGATYQWEDDPNGVDQDNQYEYVVQLKTTVVDGTTITITSDVSLWAKYGVDGNGIVSITNYYSVTSEPTEPSDWDTTPPAMSDTYKYLWNYEEIIYTDGTIKTTDPAIIGIRGDNGTDGIDAVDFQIYSLDGFEFNDNLTQIELKTVAFQKGIKLESDEISSYQWKWWNETLDGTDKYEPIQEATASSLVVNMNDIYAFSSLKCEMTYDGIVYEDYVSLTKKDSVYTAIAKFFNGSNVITSEDEYLIVYVDLYKDNMPEEVLHVNNVYISDANLIQDNIITSDLDGDYVDGDMMYFVCKNSNETIVEYNVVLGQYVLPQEQDGSPQWQLVTTKYVYRNDLFHTTSSAIVYIPKEKIFKSLNINFEIYYNDDVIARTSAVLLDLNDPVVSATPPSGQQNGQLWLDTSVSPSILKMWDGEQWVNSGYQDGSAIYTSQPTSYSEGDLWILADGEICGEFGPGSMLKATTTSNSFSESHWIDVDAEATEQRKNIKQYFLFNRDTGLRIGQSDDIFYVNISSKEMGFYDASNGTAQKVVSISNQSATIKNLTVEDGATFNCEVNFGNFILKTESNGSLSLAVLL